ncbi:MerR family DNA-binding transcriptional regulator, partial [Candidatus Bathyarchaeota archaeon]|nr:MerR family DNA-binding transcriptional regulator [Candidatus Bathyarchaeota archaeon]
MDTIEIARGLMGHRRPCLAMATARVRIRIAASMMGVSVKTVRRWDAAGIISCSRTAGGIGVARTSPRLHATASGARYHPNVVPVGN